MSDGAFRDAGALLERVTALQARNEELEAELRAGGAPGGEKEIARLRGELKDALTKLAVMTRDLAAVEANFRALRSTAASDEGVKLREENARLREARDHSNRVILKLQGDADEAARWQAEVKRFEKALHAAQEDIATLEARVKASENEPDVVGPVIHREPDVVTEVPVNLQAFMKRLQEERDELAAEVQELRAKAKANEPPTFLARFFRPR